MFVKTSPVQHFAALFLLLFNSTIKKIIVIYNVQHFMQHSASLCSMFASFKTNELAPRPCNQMEGGRYFRLAHLPAAKQSTYTPMAPLNAGNGDREIGSRDQKGQGVPRKCAKHYVSGDNTGAWAFYLKSRRSAYLIQHRASAHPSD